MLKQIVDSADFIVKTIGNTAFVNYGCKDLLTKPGFSQYLGRVFTNMPISAAYVPFISGLAISLLGDAVDYWLEEKKPAMAATSEKPKKSFYELRRLSIRVIIGEALFVGGAIIAGGAIGPALITGALVGVLTHVANRITPIAVFILRFVLGCVIGFIGLGLSKITFLATPARACGALSLALIGEIKKK